MDVKDDVNEGSPTRIDIDLTKSGSFRRYKLTPQELVVLQKGLESLPKDLKKYFSEAYLSLISKFENTEYFIVMYTSGIKSRRKKRGKQDDERIENQTK